MRSITCYVVCDECKCEVEAPTLAQARALALRDGWRLDRGGDHCQGCVERANAANDN